MNIPHIAEQPTTSIGFYGPYFVQEKLARKNMILFNTISAYKASS